MSTALVPVQTAPEYFVAGGFFSMDASGKDMPPRFVVGTPYRNSRGPHCHIVGLCLFGTIFTVYRDKGHLYKLGEDGRTLTLSMKMHNGFGAPVEYKMTDDEMAMVRQEINAGNVFDKDVN